MYKRQVTSSVGFRRRVYLVTDTSSLPILPVSTHTLTHTPSQKAHTHTHTHQLLIFMTSLQKLKLRNHSPPPTSLQWPRPPLTSQSSITVPKKVPLTVRQCIPSLFQPWRSGRSPPPPHGIRKLFARERNQSSFFMSLERFFVSFHFSQLKSYFSIAIRRRSPLV